MKDYVRTAMSLKTNFTFCLNAVCMMILDCSIWIVILYKSKPFEIKAIVSKYTLETSNRYSNIYSEGFYFEKCIVLLKKFTYNYVYVWFQIRIKYNLICCIYVGICKISVIESCTFISFEA